MNTRHSSVARRRVVAWSSRVRSGFRQGELPRGEGAAGRSDSTWRRLRGAENRQRIGIGQSAAMTGADVVRRSYELRPYPAADRRVLSPRFAHLPPLAWVQAIGRPGEPEPRRVLVAGCGTGAEAFEVRRTLPDADIVAVDFSPRSIAIAQRLQLTARLGRPITFAVADLNDPRLAQITGGDFDYVSCHGVATYLPNPTLALKNLADCVRPNGALYLGVNGDAHPGDRVRGWLADLGFQVGALRDEHRLRELLRLWDALRPGPGLELSEMPATFLAGDICGPHFNNWSLARWRETATRAGWRIVGSYALPVLLRPTLSGAVHRSLFPSRIDELITRIDAASPVSFHRLLLRRAAAGEWVWDGSAPPFPCVMRWSGLYSLRIKPPRRGDPAWAVLRYPEMELQLEWPLSAQECAAVRALARARGRPVAWPAGWPRTVAARRTLWLWVAFGVVSIRPAAPVARSGGTR